MGCPALGVWVDISKQPALPSEAPQTKNQKSKIKNQKSKIKNQKIINIKS
jgi:hypothetical protein